MKLHKNDCVAIGEAADRRIFRIVKMWAGTVQAAEVHEAGDLKKRDASKADEFKYRSISLSDVERGLVRKVPIDPIGSIRG